VANRSDEGWLAACGLLFGETPPLQEASAGRTDEVEEWHPCEEQSDDGESDDKGKDLIGHDFSPRPLREARFDDE
jgi:hypothetical protein